MKLVLFDLDHTLLNGDSEKEWGNYLIERGLIDEASYRQQHALFSQDYKKGTMDIQKLLKFQLQTLTRYTPEQLHAWRSDYLQKHIEPLLVEEGKKAIKKHHQEGADLILITATHEFLTAPIAAHLGIPHLIASLVEKDPEGNYTGASFGTPSYREGKVIRLQEWLQEQGRQWEDYEETWFYSDSHNDLPLLSLVSHPMVVNPDARLGQEALERNWKVLDFGVTRH